MRRLRVRVPSLSGPTRLIYIYITNYIVDRFVERQREERDGAREAKDRIKLSSMDLQSCITHYATWPDQSVTTLPRSRSSTNTLQTRTCNL